MRKTICILPVLAMLAGCVGGQTNQALLEPRTIDVDAAAEPAGGVISSHIQQLQAQTGPSYVTLVVHEEEKRAGAKASDCDPFFFHMLVLAC